MRDADQSISAPVVFSVVPIIFLRHIPVQLHTEIASGPPASAAAEALRVRRAGGDFRARDLNFALYWKQKIIQLSLRQVKARLDSPKGDLPLRGNFALTHPLEKCQIDYFLLRFREFSNHSADNF